MAAIVVAGAGVLYAAPAAAQATRTWVSGTGDDANPCSRTAPCKTFAGAISKTAAKGVINCIDPAGYGTLTITKSIAVVCDYTEGGVLNAGSPGMTINAATTDTVYLSGLDFSGNGTGTNGINFIQAGELHVRNTVIRQNGGSQGIQFTPNPGTTAALYLENVVISENGNSGTTTTGGVRIAPGNGAIANVTIAHSKIVDNFNAGLRVDLSAATPGTVVNLTLTDTLFKNNGVGMLLKALSGTGSINGMLVNDTVTQNSSIGIAANGPNVNVRVATSTITQNGASSAGATTGLSVANTAALQSYGNNYLDGNVNSTGTLANGAFSATIMPH